MAVHLARQTKTSESRRLAEVVRKKGRDTQIASVAARLHLAEAINLANEANLELARRSCTRSHLLSRIDGIAYCEVAAWLAHFEQILGHDDRTLELLKSAFETATPSDIGGISRASLTLADELHSLNEFQLALEFYHATRRCAEIIGDDATVSELLFNIAAHGIENCRINCIDGRNNSADVSFFVSHAKSAQRYCTLLNMSGGAWMFTLLDMNTEALTGHYRLFRSPEIWSHLETVRKTRPSLYWLHRVDKALYDIETDRIEHAASELENLLENSRCIASSEELALFYSQLSKAFSLNGIDDKRMHCEQQKIKHLHLLNGSRAQRQASDSLLATIETGRSCLRKFNLS